MLIHDLNYIETSEDLNIQGSAVSAAGFGGVGTTGNSFGTGNFVGQVFSSNIFGSSDLANFNATGNFVSQRGGFVNVGFRAFAV